jgi:two-component system, cell cycle response regulator DivK
MLSSPHPTRGGDIGGPTAPLVLLVDDDARNRKLARDVLQAAGLRTIEAASGAESIALAESHLPDVVLLDLHLPDMTGTEVAHLLTAGPRTAAIPVVALSAGYDPGREERLRARGFAGYLEKPIDVIAFPSQVRRFCAS